MARVAFAGVALRPWTAASLIDLASPPVSPLMEPPRSDLPSVTALSSFGSAGFMCTPGWLSFVALSGFAEVRGTGGSE